MPADSAGATHRFVEALLDANIEYSIGFPVGGAVRNDLCMTQQEDCVRATERGGVPDDAEVVELTGLVAMEGWPEYLRLICRRERPHPGAQPPLFDIHAGWRHSRRRPPRFGWSD